MRHLTQDDLQSEKKSDLYADFAAPILAYLCQIVSDRRDAEDLLVEVFIAAFDNAALLEFPTGRQLAWLRRVARNKAIDHYRHAARLTIAPVDHANEAEDVDLTPQQLVERRQAYERLTSVMRQLPPIQQELLRLRYGQDLRLTQIAERLGKPEGATRKLLTRALRRLRQLYEQSERGE
jgi:RNA polymerase sigma-70 factor (ECF subfamily)